MSMIPYTGNVMRPLQWCRNNAPNITTLLQSKANWYSQFNTQFWSNFTVNVFDLRTANLFGLYIWCVILNVPSQIFGLYANPKAFAFGANRNNFVYKTPPTFSGATAPNTSGSNFVGGTNSTVLNIADVRKALRMRYYALTTNGTIASINAALLDVFGNGQPWNFATKTYFYAMDSTGPTQSLTTNTPVANPFRIEYHIGANVIVSAAMLTALNNPQYGLMPQVAGCSYIVIQDT